jgi:hypothetical protein
MSTNLEISSKTKKKKKQSRVRYRGFSDLAHEKEAKRRNSRCITSLFFSDLALNKPLRKTSYPASFSIRVLQTEFHNTFKINLKNSYFYLFLKLVWRFVEWFGFNFWLKSICPAKAFSKGKKGFFLMEIFVCWEWKGLCFFFFKSWIFNW